MVATQFARGRAVAAATLALLILSSLPMPTAQAQNAALDIYLIQGEADWYQGNFFGGSRPTAFIDNGTVTSTLNVTVYNIGPATDNVPVYYWFEGMTDRTDCKKVNLPEGTVSNPAKRFVEFDVPTRPMAPGAFNVTISVFPAQVPTIVTNDNEQCTAPVNGPLPNCTIGQSCRADADTDNNVINAYFVKERYLDLKVVGYRWCEGDPVSDPRSGALAGFCDEMNVAGPEVYNTTPIDDERVSSFFEVIVENVADDEWSWANLSDYGGKCADAACDLAKTGFEFEMNVSARGKYIDGARNISAFVQTTRFYSDDDGHTFRAWTTNFPLNGLAGPYNMTIKLDPSKHLRRHPSDTAADTAWMEPPPEVAYRDFTGNFSAPGTPGAFGGLTAATALDYETFFEISGDITLANKGPAGQKSPREVNFSIYLDNTSWEDPTGTVHDNEHFIRHVKYTPEGNFSTQTYSLTWAASSNLNSENFLPPGRHQIIVKADIDEDYLEVDEKNNDFSLDIYVKDASPPRFNGTPVITLERDDPPGSPARTSYRPHEGINIEANVLDDDNLVNVTVNFTLDSNASVYRVVNATREPTDDHPERFVATVLDFKFHNFSAIRCEPNCGTENWTATIVAKDSFNNTPTVAPKLAFKLKPWPIHNATADYVIVAPDYPAGTHPWNSGPDPNWTIRVEPNMTGYVDPDDHQQFKTSNLAYNLTIQSTQKTFNLNGTYWRYQTAIAVGSPPDDPEPFGPCDPYPRQDGGLAGGLQQNLPSQTPSVCNEELNNTFIAQFPRTEIGVAPGIWNYSVRVTDVAGYTRIINGTLDLEDFLPEIQGWNLTGVAEVSPPGTVRVQANLTDDNNEVAGVYLNLTRTSPGDGQVVNITLTKRTEDATHGTTYFLYDENVSIKRGSPTAIGIGGTFNATLHVVDDVGNWNKTGLPGTFIIKDEDAPQLTGFGVTPSVVELDENITFYANATDATNVTVKLEIFRAVGSSELLMDPILIPQPSGNGPWNYTTKLNFSSEAVHGYRITAIDSANRASTPGTGTITIRDNLGPKYDIVSPSFVVDGDRYGSATPRIEVVVRDVEGVQGNTVEMKVAGLAVDFDLLPAPGNLNGYLVSYAVPAAKKFSHRDEVNVTLRATDNSSEGLTTTLNFTFVVDDVAPTARLVSISPSYRDQASHVLNVSLASRFTLAAEDLDGMPTGIPTGGIRYRILGGGPGAETVYSGPFKINDAAGVYTGPRLYQVQFWAEDDVGNFNRQFNVTTVYVDDTPPALFQFFPQGRSINATFVDDRVGVNRSAVWYRINDQAYVPLPLVEREGAWTISLPEGVKGDRISYYLQAWDRLDNTETFGNATNPYASFDVSNHEPKLKIVTPTDGSRVSRTVELRWDASDEDGDALVFTVYYRAPGKTNFVELAKIENTEARRYNIDTTRLPDGEYTFRVAAGDGGFVKLAETTVTVINSAGAIGAVNVIGEPVTGGTMLVTAEVTKAEASVTAHIYLDGVKLEEYPMNDEGRDGDVTAGDHIFSVRVPVSAAGDYRVEIATQYREDGVLKESSASPANAVFSAKLTPSYILSEYGAIIALIGLLAAVGIGVAVFVVMRRR